jgi:hypothetical protein
MKRLMILAAFVLPLMFGCDKNDNNGNPTVNYSGSYKGTITVQTNGTTSSTLADYTITFTEQGGGVMTLTNSVFAASTGKIAGNTFTLDKKIIASAPTYNTEQTGTAVFSGTSVAIQFKEQEIDNSTSGVLNTKTWVGTLIKQ